MTVLEFLGLVAAAVAAGAINAIAGGGTLLTFPVLIFFGTPGKAANATSTLALVLGTAGSIFGFRGHIQRVKPWLTRFTPVSFLGGILGGALLTWTSDRFFENLVPWLILFATILFFAQGAFRRFAGFEGIGAAHPPARAIWVAVAFQFAVSVYGGYFGAGIGILMLASLGFLGLRDIHEMNALKNVLASVINFVAAAVFVAVTVFTSEKLVDWAKAGVMTLGAVAGYFLGAHYSQRIPQHYVRRIITGIGFAISAAMFWQRLRG